MRIHQLTVSAFGPFPGTHVVDFEELNDAGVFLVTGPTGAGKTSILDAVCFALFGQVPGGRGVKRLRSDHADPDARPEVVLDFSVSGRRFVVRRTPEWERAKRSGAGTTRERAAASLLEIVDGAEVLVSSRAQEVGHFLSDLLGMTAGQFQQVALLPQGEFQTFLRATSQERHDVLQQLFRTERFTRIEDWVHDHSRRLRLEAADGEAAVRRLVDTMSDRAGLDPPAHLVGDALGAAAAADLVLPWADELVQGATTQLRTAARQHAASLHDLEGHRRAYDDAAKAAELRARRDRARGVLAALGDDDRAEQVRAALDADERARPCLPLVRLLEESTVALDAARAEHERAAAAAPVGVGDAAQAARAATARLVRLEALLPREAELESAMVRARAGAAALDDLTPRLERLRELLTRAPERREELRQRHEVDLELARKQPAAEASWRQAAAAARAAADAVPAQQLLDARESAARDARDAHADARERLLGVIERRLAGMAAELADSLEDGSPCPVCGSPDHPSPAVAGDLAVDERAQLDATAEVDALRLVHEAATARVQEARLELQRLLDASLGLEPEDAQRAAEAARETLDEAVAAGVRAEASAADLAAADHEAAALRDEVGRLEQRSAQLAATLEELGRTTSRLHDELGDELGGEVSLADAARGLRDRASAVQVLVDAATELARTEVEAARHRSAVEAVTREHGFESAEAASRAALSNEQRAMAVAQLEEHDRLLVEAQAILADPALLELSDEGPGLDELHDELSAAISRDAEAARVHHLAQETAAALVSQRERLGTALLEWAPARERSQTADSMSRLVRGMGADNQLQLRLSSYVLATRLDQVVAAANERLMQMREQRYLLERTGDTHRRGVQAGLGLRVVDEWTGEGRDPATLSGGETFVVSLALALGLSDVVSVESGGVELATLFIDEGFGMLDLDTLDDVMDRLDALRAGGRTVGVVSHVTELRNRIPTQVHVDKQRNGSSVSVTTLIA